MIRSCRAWIWEKTLGMCISQEPEAIQQQDYMDGVVEARTARTKTIFRSAVALTWITSAPRMADHQDHTTCRRRRSAKTSWATQWLENLSPVFFKVETNWAISICFLSNRISIRPRSFLDHSCKTTEKSLGSCEMVGRHCHCLEVWNIPICLNIYHLLLIG